MNELKIRKQLLPDNIGDLTRFVLIGREKLVSVRAEIRAISKIGLATEVREQKNKEAQDLAGALLDAESKIGELLKSRSTSTFKKGGEKDLPEGINKFQSSQFQSLAEHKDLIEEVKREAQENDDLPTRTEVLRKIKDYNKIEKRISDSEKYKDLVLDNQIDLRLGDFRKVLSDVKDIDLILTDPPYPVEFLPLWEDLAKFANEKLKDNGYLVAYSGQMHLPEVLNLLGKHLDYVWTFCVYHEGQTQIVNGVNVICRWKPILIFQKHKTKFDHTFQDYVISKTREKESHEWQQGLSAVEELLKNFSIEGQLVCDPFSGGGTTALACKNNKRLFVGSEIDEESFNISKGRL